MANLVGISFSQEEYRGQTEVETGLASVRPRLPPVQPNNVSGWGQAPLARSLEQLKFDYKNQSLGQPDSMGVMISEFTGGRRDRRD